MQITIDKCSKCDCSSKRPIVNRTHYLCQEKNRERLDGQSDKKKASFSSLKKTSDKQKLRLVELKTVYEEIANEREHVCTGCGSRKNLTHSHKIPRSRRKDLEADKENINYYCMDCHYKWEHGSASERQDLNDFVEAMEYIERVDISYYNLIMMKWQKERK